MVTLSDNSFYMKLALDAAWRYQGLTYPNPAVGCCLVGSRGEILSVQAHQKAGFAHAEVLALQSAYYKLTNDSSILDLSVSSDIHDYLIAHHKSIFKQCSLYSTLEPCSHMGKTPSCAALISKLAISKVYVGSEDFNPKASKGNNILSASGVKVETGVCKDKCDALLEPFKKFQTKNFVFFKWAQRLNGTLDKGIITSKSSRHLVHQMRGVCDLMVIGGDTVREDRPTLDARLANAKAPDIFIYSREKEFDQTIPLFNVKDRKVIISDNLDALSGYKNIMIEGGSQMYKLTRDIVDIYLVFIAPKFGGKTGIQEIEDEFEILNIYQEMQDIIMWIKRLNK